MSKLADGDCLLQAVDSSSHVMMTLPGHTMRYALADALVGLELKADVRTSFAAVPPLRHGTIAEADIRPPAGKRLSRDELRTWEKSLAGLRGAIFMSALGECVVRTDPAASHALLMTEVESADERTWFKTLSPALAGCTKAGETIALNPTVVRGTIAMNYYRLAKAAVPAGQGLR
ncbi:MAG: hypothetical protein M3Q52_07665 [Pseudomonadota bacterium]|nr:hypothetical protein [Pseudomonadota bacterium]